MYLFRKIHIFCKDLDKVQCSRLDRAHNLWNGSQYGVMTLIIEY